MGPFLSDLPQSTYARHMKAYFLGQQGSKPFYLVNVSSTSESELEAEVSRILAEGLDSFFNEMKELASPPHVGQIVTQVFLH